MSEHVGAQLSRRTLMGLVGAGSLLAVTGCGSNSSKSGSDVRKTIDLKLPTYKAPPALPGGKVSSVEGVPPLYTQPIQKYTNSVTSKPLNGGKVTTFQVLWGAPPRNMPANKYWSDLNNRLGGSFEPTLVAFDTYNQKLATTIASGDVPDLVFIQDSDAVGAKAIADGVFTDLTETLAGDNILKWPNLANVGTHAWKASAKNGHIFGVPNENPFLTNFPCIRWDLMQAAGHNDMPTDADGWLQMMTDIAKLKTHNGKRHWAVVAFDSKIQSVVEWMHGAGTTWQVNSAGKVVNVIETDVYPEVLAYHRKMWQNGVYHPDALALASQANKVDDMFTGGQSAFTVDAYNGFFGAGIFKKTVANTKGADPRLFVPPAAAGHKLVIPRDDGYWGMVGISSKAGKDPKRVEELLNVINYWRSPEGSTESLFINSGIENWNYKFGPNHELVDLGNDANNADRAALQWLGTFQSPDYVITGDQSKFTDNFYSTVEKLVAVTQPSPVTGVFNSALAQMGARMAAVDTDYRGGMVSGRKPMDIEAYRKAWREAGGDRVRAEYQTALDKAK